MEKLYIIYGNYDNKPFMDFTWSKEIKESAIIKTLDKNYALFSSIRVIPVPTAINRQELQDKLTRYIIKPLNK